MQCFPLFLRLAEDRRILIVGGGAVAQAKADALRPYADKVEVVAESFAPTTQAFLTAHRIPYRQASYTAALLEGVGLVIAATDNSEVNHRIYTDAHARGILVNVVDAPEYCDVIFPAIVRRGELQIAISSSGLSPVLSRLVKQQVERVIPWQFERLITFTREKRAKVKAALDTLQKRRLLWHNVLEGHVAEEVLEGNANRAETLFDSALQQAQDTHNEAALYLIGAGPGNPDLLTVKAIRLLSRADVVLYDRLVAPAILDMYARKEAEKICVGKTKDFHLKTQETIDAMIGRYLKAGKIVARLKGGDPSIFAHGAEEIAVAQALNVPYQIVPGITAATGCAAAAGIPLTERGGAQSVRFLTVYQESMGDADFWQSLRYSPRETLVFYMATHQRALLCEKLQAAGLDPATPVLAVEQGTTPEHREYEATLADFGEKYAQHRFQSPTLLIVGDVVRWRNSHGWKESPLGESKSFFPPLLDDGKPRNCAARVATGVGQGGTHAAHKEVRMDIPAWAKQTITHLNTQGGGKPWPEVLGLLAGCASRHVAFSTSFGYEDMALTHEIAAQGLSVTLFTLDTGRLFEEIQQLHQRTRERYNVLIHTYYPDALAIQEYVETRGINGFYDSVDNRKRCCFIRKVEPLQRALRGVDIWVSGLRREQSENRSDLPLAEWDAANQVVKFYPLRDATTEELWEYIKTGDVPYTPLHDHGYPSIGCAPCTRAITAGEHARAGRWWWEQGEEVNECGLHFVNGKLVRAKDVKDAE